MSLRKAEWFMLGIVALTFVLGVLVYPLMPERMASHWNAKGEVDGYTSKFWGIFLLPVFLAGLAVLFIAIPRLDPLKANITDFRVHYEQFVMIFLLFMLAMDLMVILWNRGIEISPAAVFPVGIGILIFYTGILCDHARRNWFVGIRTPWTLSSDTVWNKTHKLGAKLFKIAGVISVSGVFFRGFAIWFVLGPLLAFSIFLLVYSYMEYQKEQV